MTTEPRSVRIFVGATVAAGLLLAGVLAVARPAGPDEALWTIGFLFVAGVAAQFRPIHLTAKTKVYVDTSIFTATALVLDPLAATATAAATIAVRELILRDSWEQGLFNIAQTALYVGCGSLVFAWLTEVDRGPAVPGLGNAGAILAAVAVMFGLNTALVSVVAALQLGDDPLRTWLDGLVFDLPEHLALVANGVVLAIVLDGYPWLLPLVAAPLALVYVSLRQSSALRAAMRVSLEAAADLGELLDREPAGHSARVALRSRQLAERLGMDPRQTARVADAARVHHAMRFGAWPAGAGAPLAAAANALADYGDAVALLGHAADRAGRPGESVALPAADVPIGARMIAVADAYDRLTVTNGDRPTLAPESALAVLRLSAHGERNSFLVELMADIVDQETGTGEEAGSS